MIEAENNTSPIPKSEMLEITENGTGKFEIAINEPGTFVYKVYEKEGNEPDINYDKNIYNITVFVEDVSDNTLKYAVVAKMEGKDEKQVAIEFENAVRVETGTTTSTTTNSVTTVTTLTTTKTETSSDTSTSITESTTTKATTTVTTSTVVSTSTTVQTANQITGFITSVLTGDDFPSHAIRIVMLSAILIAISTLLFKRNHTLLGE